MDERKPDTEEKAGIGAWGVVVALLLALLAALVVYGGYGCFVWHHGRSPQEWWGPLGDSVAPVTGLLTALALGAGIVSVFMQRKELELQREEMRRQLEEFAATAKSQQELARRQAEANELEYERLRTEAAWRRHEERITRTRTLLEFHRAHQAILNEGKPINAKFPQWLDWCIRNPELEPKEWLMPFGGRLQDHHEPLLERLVGEARYLHQLKEDAYGTPLIEEAKQGAVPANPAAWAADPPERLRPARPDEDSEA